MQCSRHFDRRISRHRQTVAIAEALEDRRLLSVTATLSISASGGNWTAYAQTDNGSDNIGLASFDIDVIGSGGLAVTGSEEAAPENGSGGFNTFTSNGADGMGIAASQPTVNSPSEVAQGIGKENSSAAPVTLGLTWSTPVILATGTYSGSAGTLTVQQDTTACVQRLDIVSNGLWVGPSNITTDVVTNGSVTIGPTATQLVFASQPASTTAGDTIPSFTVDIETQSGQVLTSNNSQVTLSGFTGPGGSIIGTTTVTAVNGQATFSGLSIDKAGQYTLRATDGGLSAATSSSFDINAGPATSLAFAIGPSSAVAGMPNSPYIAVDAVDSFGNTVTSVNAEVNLTVQSGPGALSGTDAVSASSGVAFFNNAILDTAGSYTLKATEGTLTPAISSQFVVIPGSLAALSFTSQPTNTTAGVAVSPAITVELLDAFGNVETGDTSTTVTLGLSISPSGAAMSGTSMVTDFNGVATFSDVVLDTAGTYQLSANEGTSPIGSAATSDTFIVNPAAAAKLAIAPRSGPAASGIVLSPALVVDVEDAFGNVVSSDTSSVTLSIGSGPAGATLGGTANVAAVGGVATFNDVSLSDSGIYTLQAADGSLTPATLSPLSVNAADAAQLAFSGFPASETAGAPFSITVDVASSSGGLATDDDSDVTLAISSGPSGAVLGGTVTVAAVNGVATFSNLSLNTAGTYTLTATDNALTPATSGSLADNPASATQIIFAAQPTNLTAGTTFSSAIVADVEDSFGNIVTSYDSAVTLGTKVVPTGVNFTPITVDAVDGVATFSSIPNFDTAGGYKLKATQSGLTPGKSSKFFVLPAAATNFQFITQPTNIDVGSTFPSAITAAAEDAFGNIVTSYDSNITLGVKVVPMGVSFTPITEAAVDGVATFSSIPPFTTAGGYKLKATQTGLLPGKSNKFFVLASDSPNIPAAIESALLPSAADDDILGGEAGVL